MNSDLKKYRFSDAALKIYDFTWSDYCDWYLEISKGEHLNPEVLLYVLKTLLKLLHPFVPFVTEALWSHLGEKNMLIAESWPKYASKLNYPKEAEEMELVHNIITAIRSVRAEKGVEPGKKINAIIYGGLWTSLLEDKRDPLIRLGRLSNLTIQTEGPQVQNALWKFVNGVDIYLPSEDLFDIEKEKKNLVKKLEETQQKMSGLKNRLENKSFMEKAPPAIVGKEQKALSELEEELKNLQQKMDELKNL